MLLLLASLSLAQDLAFDWQSIGEKDGVHTYLSEVPDSQLYAVRGVTEIDLPAATIVGLLVDNPKKLDWVDMLVESEPIEGNDYDRLLYDRFDMPWPVWDRDYVTRRTLVINEQERWVTVTYRSVDDQRLPEVDGVVRAHAERTYWKVRPLGPARSELQVEVLTDPRGAVPAWLVNSIQRNWPHDTIQALVARASQSDVTPFEPLAGWGEPGEGASLTDAVDEGD